MKIKVTQKAFYSGHLLNPGDEIEFEGSKLPGWGAEVRRTEFAENEYNENPAGDKKQKNNSLLGRIFNGSRN